MEVTNPKFRNVTTMESDQPLEKVFDDDPMAGSDIQFNGLLFLSHHLIIAKANPNAKNHISV